MNALALLFASPVRYTTAWFASTPDLQDYTALVVRSQCYTHILCQR